MSAFPAPGYISNPARIEGESKTALEDTIAASKQIPGAGVAELTNTISGGSITPAGSGGVIVIDTEAAGATDDLTNIVTTNYPDGSTIRIRNSNAARLVVVKQLAGGAGQFNLDRAADYTLDDTKKWLLLQRRSADWFEVMRAPQRTTVPLVAKSATYTVAKEDHGKIFLCTGTFTVNLLAAASAGNGFTVGIQNVGTGTVTVDPNSSELIDGVSTLALMPGFGVFASTDGTHWYSVTGRVVQAAILQNSQSAAYTTVLADGGKHLLHPAADNNARTFTIDSNANVAYAIGTVITFVNQINVLTIAITSDTMTLAGTSSTGSRTLAVNGIATALKITSTAWIISGTGLS